jgi:hypothetical protein
MSDEERFWSKVEKGPDCWLWLGGLARGNSGKSSLQYGFFMTGTYKSKKQWIAHRFSYYLTYGEIPAGLMVRHMCHNTKCVRPDHLKVGTHKDNMQDMADAKRVNAKGERNSQSKLTVDDVVKIKAMLKEGHTSTAIATVFNVVSSNIRNIKQGTRWTHI